MQKVYVHDLKREVQSISGYYMLHKEERLVHRGREFLYAVGDGVVESSCCGVGGCRYALVPGEVLNWKSGIDPEGLATSEVEPVTDGRLKKELVEIISGREAVSQVNFW